MPSKLNKAEIRRYATAWIEKNRPTWGPDRIADSFFQRLEGRLTNIINDELNRHPSVGKTVK